MFDLKVTATGLDNLVKAVSAPAKQVRFATAVALNRSAFAGAEATKKQMRSVFQAPTPWVVGGVRYVKATKENLRAQIDFDFWGNKQGVSVEQVLKAEVFGGNRRMKRFELALQRIGVLPAGMFAVPGSAAKLDQYGNMIPGQINQILSWFQAFGEQGYSANMTGKRKATLGKDNKRTGQRGFQFFALARTHGKLPSGIYQRVALGHGSSVKPVLIFVRSPRYKQRLDFYGIGKQVAQAEFDRQFPIALNEAMRTAR